MAKAQVGIIEDYELREGVWWYLVRWPDGSTEWIPETLLEKAE